MRAVSPVKEPCVPTTPWERIDPRDAPEKVATILDQGKGIPEVTADPSDDQRFLIPDMKFLDSAFPDLEDEGALHIRIALMSGREYYTFYRKGDDISYLGAIEMMEMPPSVWMTGRRIPIAGEGAVFCAPAMTFPFGAMRSLLVKSLESFDTSEEGIIVRRWLYEGSTGSSLVEPVGNDHAAYRDAFEAVLGMDLERVDVVGTPPGDLLKGFYIGTLPGNSHLGRLVGARSVELSMAMALTLQGDVGCLDRIRSLTRGIPDDRTLFSMLDRSELDPFYLQKLFKLNKAFYKLGSFATDPIFPDTRSVNLIASSRRRGLTTDEISSMTGLTSVQLEAIEMSFGIMPEMVEGGPGRSLVLSWPEASIHLKGGKPARKGFAGSVFVTTGLRLRPPDDGWVLRAEVPADLRGRLARAYPDARVS